MALGLLFYGRLEPEKGFDGIIEMIKALHAQQPDGSEGTKEKSSPEPVEFFIFGSGSLQKELLPLTEYPTVHYFGFQPLDKIKSYLGNIDYCLMPSDFLETFGLSALNALSWGVPVVGYRKGGLEPFIEGQNNLFSYQGKTTGERLIKRCEMARTTQQKSAISPSFLDKYSTEAWYERFLALLHRPASANKPLHIVLVSDFINKVGGIETYLHDVKAILEAHGHTVKLWGGQLPKGILGKIRIYLGLLFAPLNIWSAAKFRKFVKKEQPDLIWYHSLLRNLGAGVVSSLPPVKNSSKQERKLWMMYHDFGYFYPYPKKLYAVDQIKTPLSLQHFLSAVKHEGICSKLAVLFKYFWLQPLKKQLTKQIDLHLVPSPFMEDIVSASYGLSKGKVTSLEHFIQG